jgi:hypothetical protein
MTVRRSGAGYEVTVMAFSAIGTSKRELTD